MKDAAIRSVLTLAVIGCTHVAPVRDARSYVATRSPHQIWITSTGTDSVRAMQQPRVEGDTLVGLVAGRDEQVPVADLKQVLGVQPAPRRVVALIALPLAGIGIYELVASALRQPHVRPYSVPVACDCDFLSTCC